MQAGWRASGSWTGERWGPGPSPEQAWAEQLRGHHALSSPGYSPMFPIFWIVSATPSSRTPASHTEFLGPHFHPASWNINFPPLRRQEKHSSGPSRTKGPLSGRGVGRHTGGRGGPSSTCCTAAGPDSRRGRPREQGTTWLCLEREAGKGSGLYGHGEEGPFAHTGAVSSLYQTQGQQPIA